MAKHLARIHGTEEDKVNCPFYFKIGACRHSDRCSRLHHKPAFSPTLLVKHIYRKTDGPSEQEDFLCFYEDFYMEFSKFGRIEAMHVVDNIGDHMIGHMYVKFMDEEQASDALQVMNGRYYDGRPMQVEFSPVTDFREARCRDYDEDSCSRGGYCNFLHIKAVPFCLIRSMEEDCEIDRRKHEEEQREREREERRKKRKREKRDRDDRRKSRHHHHHHRSRGRDDDSASDDDDDEGSYDDDHDRPSRS